jgi:hypothetical protein
MVSHLSRGGVAGADARGRVGAGVDGPRGERSSTAAEEHAAAQRPPSHALTTVPSVARAAQDTGSWGKMRRDRGSGRSSPRGQSRRGQRSGVELGAAEEAC